MLRKLAILVVGMDCLVHLDLVGNQDLQVPPVRMDPLEHQACKENQGFVEKLAIQVKFYQSVSSFK